MAARHWTDEQRAAQSLAIQAWKPWEKVVPGQLQDKVKQP